MALSLTVKLAQPMAAKMRRASPPHFVEGSKPFGPTHGVQKGRSGS
jgi:hypothetical protein